MLIDNELSPEELKQLPLRAIVAFAARQARTVVRDFDIDEGNPDVKITAADLEEAVCLCERYGGGESVSKEEASRARATTDAMFQAAIPETDVERANMIRSAFLAADAAMNHPSDKDAVANHAANACVFAELPYEEELTEAAREAFEFLLAASEREGWTDETPVAPEFFENMQ